jgi:serine O-acetyltransferase
MAFFLQNLVSQNLGVDVHPAATIGHGIMIDHATGLVIGETAVVDNNVSILHSVTLGGTGTECGRDRHPKIREGVLLATGAKVLGCVEVGEGAKVAAGSLVLEDVEPHTTVAGVPARVVGKPSVDLPALSMTQDLSE